MTTRYRSLFVSEFLGNRRGLRVDQYIGPWASIGVHVHPWPLNRAHIDFHIGWWLICFGFHWMTREGRGVTP